MATTLISISPVLHIPTHLPQPTEPLMAFESSLGVAAWSIMHSCPIGPPMVDLLCVNIMTSLMSGNWLTYSPGVHIHKHCANSSSGSPCTTACNNDKSDRVAQCVEMYAPRPQHTPHR